MIENAIRNLDGVGIYGILSICLFFSFFIGMLLWTARLKRPYLKSMGQLPLDDRPAGPLCNPPTLNPQDHHERPE